MNNYDLSKLEIQESISFIDYGVMIRQIVDQVFANGVYNPGCETIFRQAAVIHSYTNLITSRMEVIQIYDLINSTDIIDRLKATIKNYDNIQYDVERAVNARLSTCSSFEHLLSSLAKFLEGAATADISENKNDTKELIELFKTTISNPDIMSLVGGKTNEYQSF